MKTSSRRDYLQRIYQRYRDARSSEKGHILDEFCANCGYHRKYAIRLLNGAPPESKPVSRPRRRRKASYGAQVISILEAVWEAADYPWSLRLKALVPQWMPWIRRHFRLTAEIEEQLQRISPRTIDYRLRSRPRVLGKRIYGNTKAKTTHPGKDRSLGGSDTGIHGDRFGVAFGGVGGRGLLPLLEPNRHLQHLGGNPCGAGQGAARRAPGAGGNWPSLALSPTGNRFRQRFRIYQCALVRLLSVAGHSVHPRATLQKRWQRAPWAEELDAVRRLLGYARYDSQRALEAINDLYANELHLFRNLFLPSVKLVRKVRVGSRTRRIYGKPQTPFQRVCASPASDPERIAGLKRQQQKLDPFELSRAIQTKLEHIFQLSQELAGRGKPQTAIVQNGSECQIPKAEKNTMHKTERSREKRGKMTARQSTKKPRRFASYTS
jgi:hypothetical protein